MPRYELVSAPLHSANNDGMPLTIVQEALGQLPQVLFIHFISNRETPDIDLTYVYFHSVILQVSLFLI